MAEITVLKLPLQRQLIAATYRHDFAEMKRIYYTLYPDDPGAKEWLEEQEKGSNQSPRELASNWVYKVHAWRGKSPEFMQAQVSRLEAVIREAMQLAQPQWISVEEKLPKVDEKVLAYAPKYAETPEESVITTWFEVDGWMVENDCGADVEITHWQPLPEPPNTTAAVSLTAKEPRP